MSPSSTWPTGSTRRCASSIDTGRLPQETYDLIEQLRDRYEGLQLELSRPTPRRCSARRPARAQPVLKSVEKRLLCCNVRKVQPLHGVVAGLDAWVTGLRRDQWAIALQHPQDRDRPRPRRDREAVPARRVDGRRGLGLHPRERRAHPSLYEQGYTSIGCAPCTRPVAAGRARPRRTLVVERAPKECGMHCAIETGGFEHELHAILGEGSHA